MCYVESPIEILYKDEYLVIVNKPSGLLVHKSMIDKRETKFLLQILRDQIGQYVYPIHRLDKPTSGVIVFALKKEIINDISKEFREGNVYKEYLAVVRGYIDDKGIIDYPLKQMLDTKEEKSKGITKEKQSAITKYIKEGMIELPYSVSRYPTTRYSLVRLIPKTGRKHQLRRHMKHIFHPIVGDTKHGRGEHNRMFRENFNSHRLLLHASKIKFTHPILFKTIEVSAPLDETMSKLFKEFKWQVPNSI